MPKQEIGLNPPARVALKKYIEYLNLWQEDEKRRYPDYEGHKFEWEDFFKYGETKLLKDFDVPGYFTERIIVMQVGTGDEGGPSLLIAKFARDGKPGRPREDEWMMRWMMQEFDTMGAMIWSEGKWLNVPELEAVSE